MLRSLLLSMILVTGFALDSGAADSAADVTRGSWQCTASGYENGRNPSEPGPGRRRSVTGAVKSTQNAASQSAMSLCMGAGLLYCGVDNCSKF